MKRPSIADRVWLEHTSIEAYESMDPQYLEYESIHLS